MEINFYKIKSVLIFYLIFLMSLFLFAKQIQQDNEYLGMLGIDFDLRLFGTLFIHFIMLIFISDYKNNLSSNFINFFLYFVLIWFFIFFDLVGKIDFQAYILLNTLIFIPILFFYLSKYIRVLFEKLGIDIYKLNMLYFINLNILLSTLLLFTLLVISIKMPLEFGFDSSYERRTLGYEVITGAYAYLFSICMNGIAPYLAFLSILRRNYFYFILSFVFVIFCFGFIGVKAPILYVCFFAFLGFFIRKVDFNLSYFILKLVFFILVFATIEYLIFNFSWIADLIVRRAFVVVAQNQLYFIDYFLNYFDFYDWLFGRGGNITYIIGDMYHNIPNTNANVNALLYEIGRNGIFGYIIMLLFLVFFFSFLDYIYLKYNNKDILGIGILYIILLLEQSYSTAFITSGVFVITILTFLTINNKEYNEK